MTVADGQVGDPAGPVPSLAYSLAVATDPAGETYCLRAGGTTVRLSVVAESEFGPPTVEHATGVAAPPTDTPEPVYDSAVPSSTCYDSFRRQHASYVQILGLVAYGRDDCQRVEIDGRLVAGGRLVADTDLYYPGTGFDSASPACQNNVYSSTAPVPVSIRYGSTTGADGRERWYLCTSVAGVEHSVEVRNQKSDPDPPVVRWDPDPY